jgi:hypothetical protein
LARWTDFSGRVIRDGNGGFNFYSGQDMLPTNVIAVIALERAVTP